MSGAMVGGWNAALGRSSGTAPAEDEAGAEPLAGLRLDVHASDAHRHLRGRTSHRTVDGWNVYMVDTPYHHNAAEGYDDGFRHMSTEAAEGADRMCTAAGAGDLAGVNKLLGEGVSASVQGGYMRFPVLKHAATKGHLHVMDVLLRHGADIDQRGHDGLTALHFAAFMFQLESMRFLLDRGARVSVEDNSGKTPLMSALSMFLPCMQMNERRLAVISGLLEAGAAVHGHGANRLSALVQVVRAPDFCIPRALQLRTFDLLLAHGADAHERNGTMKTALHYAARCNNFEMILRLLGLGVDVNAVDADGRTALDSVQRGEGAGDDTRAREILDALQRRVRDKPKMLAFSMGLRAIDAKCSVRILSMDLVRVIFDARKPETASEHELEALAELQLRLHGGVLV